MWLRKKPIKAERIAAEQEIRDREIGRDEAVETREISKRDKVERERINVELNVDRERIEASKARDLVDIDRKTVIEQADEQRIVALAEAKSERAGAEARIKQAEIAAHSVTWTGPMSSVSRRWMQPGWSASGRWSNWKSPVCRRCVKQRLRHARILNALALRLNAASMRPASGMRQNGASWRSIASAKSNPPKWKRLSIFTGSRLNSRQPRLKPMLPAPRAAEAEERVKTTRETEEANRRRSVDVVMAEKAAAESRIAAEADQIRAAVEAEAQKLLYEAENVLSDEARFGLFRRKLLDKVEGIVVGFGQANGKNKGHPHHAAGWSSNATVAAPAATEAARGPPPTR